LTCSEECDLNTIVSHILCDDNGSPMDPTDNLFTFDLRVEGQNVSGHWTSDDGVLAGSYDSIYRLGPFPIGEGSRSWTITDDNNTSLLPYTTLFRSLTCSEECDLNTFVSHILCDDNGSSMDSTDDVYTFDLQVEGQNVSETWTSDDGLLTGNQNSIHLMARFLKSAKSGFWFITEDNITSFQSITT